jgi:hypothetical protein
VTEAAVAFKEAFREASLAEASLAAAVQPSQPSQQSQQSQQPAAARRPGRPNRGGTGIGSRVTLLSGESGQI